jgi:hypothetical protein
MPKKVGSINTVKSWLASNARANSIGSLRRLLEGGRGMVFRFGSKPTETKPWPQLVKIAHEIEAETDPKIIQSNYDVLRKGFEWSKLHGTPEDIGSSGYLYELALHRLRRVSGEDEQTTRNVVATKPCTVPGCAGTMYFHERLTVAPGEHTLGWPWRDYWECAQDSTHVELLAARP